MKIKNKLKFSIIGNGGISKSIQNHISERGHNINTVIDQGDIWNIKNADLVIEATTPISVLDNVERILSEQKDLIIVTTGWYDKIEEVKKMVKKFNGKFLWSSNFSIGVNLYFKIVETASRLMNNFDEYDVWGTEIHHKNKVDSPSGTAKTIEKIILDNIQRKSKVVEHDLQRKIEDDEFHFSSTRGGMVNFGHTVAFDSPSDVIEIKHSARNRNAYALGTIKAAEWLSIQSPGFYEMDDFLSDILM